MSEIMFSHQKRVKKALFYTTSPQGILFCQNKESVVKPSKWSYRDAFFNPHFWPFKNHWTCQKSCFLIRRGLKKHFFLSDLPQGVLFCQIRVSCQTFKMVIQRCFFLTPHFWPFKNHWTCQKSCFPIRRGLKSLFYTIWPPPGSCFAKIRVSCQTFKMVIERCFF